MNEFLLRPRNIEQRVVRSRPFAQTRTNRDEEIGVADAFRERRVQSDRDVARVVRMPIVEEILTAIRAAHGERMGSRESADVLARLRIPSPAAQHQ